MFMRRAPDTIAVTVTDAASIKLPRKSAAHQIAERELAKLRERRAQIAGEIPARNARRDSDQVGDKIVARLAAELEKIDREIVYAREGLAPLRAAHAAAVELTLRPALASAAQSLLETIEATVEKRGALVQLLRHVEIAAGESRPVAEFDAAVLLRQARRLAISK